MEDIISKVIRERDRWEHNGINRRKNEICFIYDLDYYRDYDKFWLHMVENFWNLH